MKVLLLSRYGSLGASSRVRFLQYSPYFKLQGAELTVKPLFSDAYVQALYSGGSRWREVLKGYIARTIALLSASSFDVIVIEKEIFPFMPAIVERLLRLIGVPYVVDYDDALFHRYDCHSSSWVRFLLGKKIDSVMRHANCVVAGNQYLAERAHRAGARKVEIVPTVVDTDRYQLKQRPKTAIVTVGWIGTPQTSLYLSPLLPVFQLLRKKMSVRFVAVGANPEDFSGTSVEVWTWAEDSEIKSVQEFDIGIMPLPDSPWERGKCGYKLIQYMACGVAVVASPVGVNREIVKEGQNGMLADSVQEWAEVLATMLEAGLPRLEEMGRVGREDVVEWYSLQAQAPRFYSIVKETANL